MMVRYSCGCIGIPWHQSDVEDTAIIIAACDADLESPNSFYLREMHHKKFVVLGISESNAYIGLLGGLVADGISLRQIRSIITQGMHQYVRPREGNC